jgi:hypothetical protein
VPPSSFYNRETSGKGGPPISSHTCRDLQLRAACNVLATLFGYPTPRRGNKQYAIAPGITLQVRKRWPIDISGWRGSVVVFTAELEPSFPFISWQPEELTRRTFSISDQCQPPLMRGCFCCDTQPHPILHRATYSRIDASLL